MILWSCENLVGRATMPNIAASLCAAVPFQLIELPFLAAGFGVVRYRCFVFRCVGCICPLARVPALDCSGASALLCGLRRLFSVVPRPSSAGAFASR